MVRLFERVALLDKLIDERWVKERVAVDAQSVHIRQVVGLCIDLDGRCNDTKDCPESPTRVGVGVVLKSVTVPITALSSVSVALSTSMVDNDVVSVGAMVRHAA